MEGLFAIFQNSIGEYLCDIANSFEKTQNLEIANCLKNSLAILTKFDLSPNKIRQKYISKSTQYLVQENNFTNNERLIEEINAINIKLQPLILKKDFWINVSDFVKQNIVK